MIPPTSNWLTIDKNILIGKNPTKQTDIDLILKNDIHIIVNLMNKAEGKNRIKYEDQDNIKYYHYPIQYMTTLSDNKMIQIALSIISEVKKGHKVFIHSKDGHGRTGTLSGIIIHKLYPKLSYQQILENLSNNHKTREIKPNMSTPQTAQQFNQLLRIIDKKDDIYFYDEKDPNIVFSNYYTRPKKEALFNLDGKDWYSSEAYYQSQKFLPTTIHAKEYIEYIRTAVTSNYTFLLGNQDTRKNIRPAWIINNTTKEKVRDIVTKYKSLVSIRPDWNDIQEKIMLKAILAKFTQNLDLFLFLMNTQNKKIIEFSPRDMYWGTYWNKKGKNMLGKSLIKLRNCIKPRETEYQQILEKLVSINYYTH
jgi:predicted NAD-dependent protein-ADP-ribosyltransferase YbiA (DUF1768 family)